MAEISEYWKNKCVAKKEEGRVFDTDSSYMHAKGIYYMCNECCNGDRCDDPTHKWRTKCTACLGTGQNLTSEKLNAEKQLNNNYDPETEKTTSKKKVH